MAGIGNHADVSSASSAGSARPLGVRRPSPSGSSGRNGISTRPQAAWAGLALVLLYTLGQWRDIVATFHQRGRRATARWRSSAGARASPSWSAVNYLAARQNKRWDLTAQQAEQPVRADRQGAAGPQRAGAIHGLRQADRLRAVPRPARRSTPTTRPRCRSTTSTPTSVRRSHADPTSSVRHRSCRLQGQHRAGHHRPTSRTSPTRSSRRCPGAWSARSTSSRATARRTRRAATSATGYSAVSESLQPRQLHGRDGWCSRRSRRCPPTRRSCVIAGPTTDLPGPEVEALDATSPGRQGAGHARSRPDTADAPPLTGLVALVARVGRRRSATTSSSTRAASARCSAASLACRSWRPTRPTRSPSASAS